MSKWRLRSQPHNVHTRGIHFLSDDKRTIAAIYHQPAAEVIRRAPETEQHYKNAQEVVKNIIHRIDRDGTLELTPTERQTLVAVGHGLTVEVD